MKDVQLLVLNDDQKQAGVGELAELYVRSPHLSAGYKDLPDATAAKFLINPLTGAARDRLYRTGDLGRYLPDGSVECIGRADDQVKIRGFRIELGEIDTHLGQHPHIRENRTRVMRDAQEEKHIISFFVPTVDDYYLEDIKAHLKKKLPSYAVPSIFYPLKKFPLTPNGKIDMKKLPSPDMALRMLNKTEPSAAQTGQLTPLEKKIISIWTSVLGRQVSVEDNFFECGGHSISAMELARRLYKELNFDRFTQSLVYQYPTVRELAQALEMSALDSMHELPASTRSTAEHIDLAEELKSLGVDKLQASGRPAKQGQPSHILVTGATGFLGAYIVSELMERLPDATVECLVRPKAGADLLQRVVDNLVSNGLWQQSYKNRVKAVSGNLSEPNLGLSDADWKRLGSQVDCIIHNGAVVHWVFPYSKLKAANVVASRDILRLASAGPELVPTYFVSSTSVFDSSAYVQSPKAILESDDMSRGADLSVGYAQSKWVAENIMLRAASHGLPAYIIRPGYVTGHSRNGITNLDDYLVRLLVGCTQLKLAPRMDNRINMCSVDYVAETIVAIARARPTAKAFHIWQPERFSFNDLFGALADYGWDVEFVDYIAWRDALDKHAQESNDSALEPLLHFVLDDLPTRSTTPMLNWTNTRQVVQRMNVNPVKPIQQLMGVYLQYLRQMGQLPEPQEGKFALPDIDIPAEHKASKRSTASKA